MNCVQEWHYVPILFFGGGDCLYCIFVSISLENQSHADIMPFHFIHSCRMLYNILLKYCHGMQFGIFINLHFAVVQQFLQGCYWCSCPAMSDYVITIANIPSANIRSADVSCVG